MSKKILMVDDDEEMCEEMSEILRSEGFAVSTVFNGLDGQRLIEKNDYDLVLLDVKMPGLEGYDVLRNTRAKKPGLKVIVLTGRPMTANGKASRATDDDERKAQILGSADCVMNKPFDVDKVLGKVIELIGR